ncbi:D-alanyl-D-alanine carboxypeptidase [Erythrobacter phage vB_EliS_R6L]|nr:D-alanyl-D-alanine carboxypeptidase [Erythrobacter phage vB_EliS_R6L]
MIPGAVAGTIPGVAAAVVSPPATNLKAWYDAADFDSLTLRDGEFVSQWDDKSGNGFHLVQATDANQPLFVDEGKPRVRLPGFPRRMTAPMTTTAQPITIVLVCSTEQATGGVFVDATSSSNRVVVGALSGSSNDFVMWAGSGSGVPSYGNQPAPFGLYVSTYNGASSTARRNGAQVATGNPGPQSMTGITLGCRYSIERFLPGDVYEMLIYSGALSASDLAALEQYLMTKWDVPLPPPPVSAQYVYVQDLDSGRSLYSKAADTATVTNAAASLAKMATALIVLDRKGSVLDSETVTVEAGDLPGAGNTLAGLEAGDVLTWRELLHGLIIPSGNDAALCIGRVIGTEIYAGTGTGTTGVTRFVEEMNALAASLGMANTTFGTPSGVGGDNFYTVRDINTLGRAFYRKALLRDISAKPTYDMTITGANARSEPTRHTSAVVSGPFSDQTQGLTDDNVIGSKTGSAPASNSYSINAVWVSPNGTKVLVTVLRSSTTYARYLDIRAIFYRLVKDYPYLAAGAPASASDPSFASTTLLIGADTAIVDESPLAQTVSVSGATRNSTNPIIGTHSIQTDGVDDRISVADGAGVSMGSGDWTLEFWYRGTGAEQSPASGLNAMAGKYSRSGNQREFGLVYATSNQFEIYCSGDGSTFEAAINALPGGNTEANIFFNGAARHFCIQRSGTEVALFINGEKQAATITFAGSIYDGTAPFMVGARASGAGIEDPTAGMFDEIRLTKGVARYPTAMFTPEPRPYPRS